MRSAGDQCACLGRSPPLSAQEKNDAVAAAVVRLEPQEPRSTEDRPGGRLVELTKS
jgi:hypothetical protein